MKIASRTALTLLIPLLMPAISLAISSKDFIAYRDQEKKFIFQYPNTWAQVPSTHERTRIKIVNDNGNGRQDCAVNVQFDSNSRKQSPKEFLRSTPSVKEFEKGLRKTLPDAKLIKRGATFISNQDAIYNIVDFTIRSVGIEVPIRMYMVQTARDGNIYTISCRAGQQEFDEYASEFELIFSGFLIKP